MKTIDDKPPWAVVDGGDNTGGYTSEAEQVKEFDLSALCGKKVRKKRPGHKAEAGNRAQAESPGHEQEAVSQSPGYVREEAAEAQNGVSEDFSQPLGDSTDAQPEPQADVQEATEENCEEVFIDQNDTIDADTSTILTELFIPLENTPLYMPQAECLGDSAGGSNKPQASLSGETWEAGVEPPHQSPGDNAEVQPKPLPDVQETGLFEGDKLQKGWKGWKDAGIFGQEKYLTGITYFDERIEAGAYENLEQAMTDAHEVLREANTVVHKAAEGSDMETIVMEMYGVPLEIFKEIDNPLYKLLDRCVLVGNARYRMHLKKSLFSMATGNNPELEALKTALIKTGDIDPPGKQGGGGGNVYLLLDSADEEA